MAKIKEDKMKTYAISADRKNVRLDRVIVSLNDSAGNMQRVDTRRQISEITLQIFIGSDWDIVADASIRVRLWCLIQKLLTTLEFHP